MTTSEEKLRAISELKFPQNLNDLEIYIGLTGYMRQYVPHYAAKIEPLQHLKTELLKKVPKQGSARAQYTRHTPIKPNAEQLQAYEAVQSAFAQPTTLAHHTPNRQLYIDLDASKKRGFSVVAYHIRGDPTGTEQTKRSKIEPVLFLGRMLTGAESRYWPTELKVAGLCWAVRKLSIMIRTAKKPPIVFTDHSAAPAIAKQTSLTTSSVDKLNMRLIRASQYFFQYQLDLRYKPGKQHVLPDALTRLPAAKDIIGPGSELDDLTALFATAWDEATADAIVYSFSTSHVEMSSDFKGALRLAYEEDKHYSQMLPHLREDTSESLTPQYVLRDDLIYHVDAHDGRLRLCIPKTFQGEVFAAAHDEQAHAGFHRVHERLRASYYIRKLDRQLRDYIRLCRICQTTQTRRKARHGELRPIQTPASLHTITIDIVVGLPNCDGYDAFMSVTNKFSKRVTFVPGHTNW